MVAVFVVVVGSTSLSASTASPSALAASPSNPSGASELPGPDPLLRELIGFKVLYKNLLKHNVGLVRSITIPYRAWNGARRQALVVVPKWYGPTSDRRSRS
jgi:hypothetical protein